MVEVFLPSRLPMKMDSMDHSLTVKKVDKEFFELSDDGNSYGTISITNNPLAIMLKWKEGITLEQRHLYRSAPILIKITCKDLGSDGAGGGVGLWYDLSRQSMKMKDSLKVNRALDANKTPTIVSKCDFSQTSDPDPVSGFSWNVSEDHGFWEVQKNLFYKTFQIEKTSFEFKDKHSKAFNFNEYSNFLEEKNVIRIGNLKEKILEFLPFNEEEITHEFTAWSKKYLSENIDDDKRLRLSKDWIAYLGSNTEMDKKYDKFICQKLRIEDDKKEKPMYLDIDKKEKPIPPEDILKQIDNPVYAREFFPEVLKKFNEKQVDIAKKSQETGLHFMLVKYFVKCLDMKTFDETLSSFPTGTIEVTHECSFPNSCFFVGNEAQTSLPWFEYMLPKESRPKGIKTSLGIDVYVPVGKPGSQ